MRLSQLNEAAKYAYAESQLENVRPTPNNSPPSPLIVRLFFRPARVPCSLNLSVLPGRAARARINERFHRLPPSRSARALHTPPPSRCVPELRTAPPSRCVPALHAPPPSRSAPALRIPPLSRCAPVLHTRRPAPYASTPNGPSSVPVRIRARGPAARPATCSPPTNGYVRGERAGRDRAPKSRTIEGSWHRIVRRRSERS